MHLLSRRQLVAPKMIRRRPRAGQRWHAAGGGCPCVPPGLVTWRPWLEDRVLRQMQDLPSEAFDLEAVRPVVDFEALKDPRRPASLMHACIVVSLMAGVRPEEARAIGWEEDVDLDGTPPLVAVPRADRAGGDAKTPRSRRALKLAQLAVGALRE